MDSNLLEVERLLRVIADPSGDEGYFEEDLHNLYQALFTVSPDIDYPSQNVPSIYEAYYGVVNTPFEEHLAAPAALLYVATGMVYLYKHMEQQATGDRSRRTAVPVNEVRILQLMTEKVLDETGDQEPEENAGFFRRLANKAKDVAEEQGFIGSASVIIMGYEQGRFTFRRESPHADRMRDHYDSQHNKRIKHSSSSTFSIGGFTIGSGSPDQLPMESDRVRRSDTRSYETMLLSKQSLENLYHALVSYPDPERIGDRSKNNLSNIYVCSTLLMMEAVDAPEEKKTWF